MASNSEPGLGDYLKQIKEYDLLTPEQERELGQKIRAAADSREHLAKKVITIEEYSRIQREAAESRNHMIQANLRLVVSVAKNFRNRGLPMEDLINEGNVGLVNAVDRFDPEMGSRFSTYASYWIDQAIRRAIQNATQMIHIPSYLMDQISQMRLAMRELEEQFGRQPSMDELATHLEITPRRAGAISKAIKACTCPTQAPGIDDEASLTESLPDTRTPRPFDSMFSESDRQFVRKALASINEREATVLQLRYGLRGKKRKPMTLKEIGAEVGLTRERVRQIEKEAKRKLEGPVQEYMDPQGGTHANGGGSSSH
ncbi:MAG: sigma-70 family RNA polymerase sigma factor [Phycisphaerae bacterium]|nr:sigma-70 family RNA polymerase sigma factor [Phycisphaerae bacterium]